MPKYSTYSGADIVCVFRFPEFMEEDPMVFGSIKTISYSTYRDKFPVRGLGSINARGFTKGARTIAGTMVFTLFNEPIVRQFASKLYEENINIAPDEIPSFDVDITLLNEYGNHTNITLYDVEIVEGNQIMTIDNLETNEQYSFVAQGIE